MEKRGLRSCVIPVFFTQLLKAENQAGGTSFQQASYPVAAAHMLEY